MADSKASLPRQVHWNSGIIRYPLSHGMLKYSIYTFHMSGRVASVPPTKAEFVFVSRAIVTQSREAESEMMAILGGNDTDCNPSSFDRDERAAKQRQRKKLRNEIAQKEDTNEMEQGQRRRPLLQTQALRITPRPLQRFCVPDGGPSSCTLVVEWSVYPANYSVKTTNPQNSRGPLSQRLH